MISVCAGHMYCISLPWRDAIWLEGGNTFNNSVACDLGEIISFDMNQCQLKVAFKTSSQQNDSHQLKNTFDISIFILPNGHFEIKYWLLNSPRLNPLFSETENAKISKFTAVSAEQSCFSWWCVGSSSQVFFTCSSLLSCFRRNFCQ